jgi:hypothetical protein
VNLERLLQGASAPLQFDRQLLRDGVAGAYEQHSSFSQVAILTMIVVLRSSGEEILDTISLFRPAPAHRIRVAFQMDSSRLTCPPSLFFAVQLPAALLTA